MSAPGGRSWPRTAAVLVATAALGACGISSDDSPRELAVTTSTSTTVAPEPSGTAPAVLYFVQGERLVPITRALPARNDEAILESLLQAPTPDEGASLSSSIPSGTQLEGLDHSGSILSVELSEEFNDVVGPSRQQAIGQMVLSETGLEDVDQLTFSIDGRPFKVTTSRGDVDVVSACDYASMLADPSADDAELTTGQITLLELRRKELEEQCP